MARSVIRRRDTRRLLAAVHAGRRALGLDDATYRALLQRITGRRSAADATPRDLQQVIEEMRRLGFERVGWRRLEEPHQRKILAMWRRMYDAGLVRERDPDGFVRRMAGVDRLEWLRAAEAEPVIEALKDWSERAGG